MQETRTTGTISTSLPIADALSAEEADIYTTVLRELIGVDHTFGKGHRFETVYILDRIDQSAADPTGMNTSHSDPFSSSDQKLLEGAITEVALVAFTAPPSAPGEWRELVVDNSAVASLGPIELKSPGVAHVGVNLFCGDLCGHWLTYVVEDSASGWVVTGTTGPAAIS